MFEKSFYIENRKTFLEGIKPNSLALFFSGWPVCRSGDANYPFSADNHFYYLTGIREAEEVLVLKKDCHGSAKEILFISRADPEKEKWTGKKISADQAEIISGIADIRYTDTLEVWLKEQQSERVYLDSWAVAHQQSKRSACLKPIQDLPVEDAVPLLRKMRNIKKAPEIEAIRRGIALTAKGIEAVKAVLHPGVYEYQLQAIFEYMIAMGGAEEPAFGTIVASGTNGAILHYESNRNCIEENTLVLLDLGAKIEGYSSDISRTLFCGAQPSKDQLAVFDSVLTVQKALIPLYQPGTAMKSIQEAAKKMLFEQAVERGLVQARSSIDEIYYHGVGHPLGLDTHDLGRQEDLVLKPGMVITCEPGLYFREKGIGVRIEDDILITDKGPVNLSEKIPKEWTICS